MAQELYKRQCNGDTVEIECKTKHSWFKFTGWSEDSEEWKNGNVIENALPYLYELGDSTAHMPTYDVLMVQELLRNQLCEKCRGKI
jgi:hypothetical protein